MRVRVQEDFAIVTSRDEMEIKRMSGIIMRRRRYPFHNLVSNLVVETNPRVSHPSPLLSVTPVRASHRKLLFHRIVLYHPPIQEDARRNSSHRKDKWMRHRIQQRDVQNFKSNSRHGDNGRAVDWLAVPSKEQLVLVDKSIKVAEE